MRDPRTLLERIAHPQRPPGEERLLLEDSVRHNLRVLLNTQRGSVLSDPDYGLPDPRTLPRALEGNVGDDVAQPVVEEFKRDLRRAVERYEPRLRVMRLNAKLDPGIALHFELQGTLVDGTVSFGSFVASAELEPSGALTLQNTGVARGW